MRKLAVCMVLMLAAVKLNAQDPDPRIFSEWYVLEYIEDGVSYISPDNYLLEIFEEGVQDCPNLFYLPNPYQSGQSCLEFSTEDQFVVLSLGILTEGEICQDGPAECKLFFDEYYDLFSNATISGDPISFMIEETQDKRTLTLTNLEGDQAIYSNQYLSVRDNAKAKTMVYPNPVTDQLIIESDAQIAGTRIYSLQGKLILETEASTINCSSLQSGMYFVEIGYNQGKEILKIIKQ